MSKKEQKAKEDAEFAALMSEVGVADKTADAKKPEEAAAAQPGEGNAKNKKKKEKAAKAKAAKEAAAKNEEKKDEGEAKELTKEEKAAAVKEAMAKRGNI